MKLKFSLRNKEASLEADVEGIVKKSIEERQKNPNRKTRYQIKQEEKRKNKELEHKQMIQSAILMMVILVVIIVICVIMSMLGIE